MTTPVDDPTVDDVSPEDSAAVAAVIAPAVRRMASFHDLIKKPVRETEFDVTLPDDANQPVTYVMRFRAIPGAQYDDLMAQNPPTEKQRARGEAYNPDTFAPALISAVSLEPKLSVDQVKEIWASEQWSSGERTNLFIQALSVCQSGLDVPFTGRG